MNTNDDNLTPDLQINKENAAEETQRNAAETSGKTVAEDTRRNAIELPTDPTAGLSEAVPTAEVPEADPTGKEPSKKQTSDNPSKPKKKRKKKRRKKGKRKKKKKSTFRKKLRRILKGSFLAGLLYPGKSEASGLNSKRSVSSEQNSGKNASSEQNSGKKASSEQNAGKAAVSDPTIGNKSSDRANKDKKFPKWFMPALIGAIAALVIGAVIFGVIFHKKAMARDAERAAEDASFKQTTYDFAQETFHKHAVEQISKGTGENIADALARSGKTTLEGIKNRPPYVKLTDENTSDFVAVESVLYNSETGMVDVEVKAAANVLPISDDGYYYLFATHIYDDELPTEPVTKIEKDVDFTISCNLNYNSADSRLFDRFSIGVLLDGKYVQVSNEMYLTNPKAKATYSSSRDGEGNKKGLLVNPDMVTGGQLQDLGVKHAAYNVYTSLILNGSGISYTYNGHTYSYNAYQVGLYDLVFTRLSSQGVDVNAIIINDLNNSTITYPGSRGAGATLYAFNPTDEEGVNAMAALANFLANRYSGTQGHGKVTNWIIGNEVNERTIYNYTPSMGLQEYAELYADTVRVFYNAMAAVNSTTRVYVSFDNRWNLDKGDSSYFDVKDMLDAYNSYINSEGNFDWDVGYHSYNYPLDAPKVWNTGKYDSLTTTSASSPIISMKNIQVLTDYLGQENYLNTEGNVRHVVLSEMGYTSSQGQELQAASIAYAYKAMEANSHIDYMLLSRQVDAASEVAQGMALGITGKTAYNVYKACGTSNESSVLNPYLSVIGISSWSEIQKSR